VTIGNLTRVVLWMVGALLSFSGLAVSIRLLSKTLNLFEIFSIRAGVGLAIVLILLLLRPDYRPLIRTSRIRLQLFRNTLHYAAQFCWALALTLLPFATVFALEFSAPAWTALLAVWLLHEKLTSSRIGVVVLGLAGVLIILRPGLADFNPAVFLVLVAAAGYAGVFISTKSLTSTDTTLGIIFWMTVIQLPLSLVGSDIAFPMRMDPADGLAALTLGITGTASHYCLTNAFRAGDAMLVVPLDFMRVPLIALIGWGFFGEALDLWVFVGAAVILSGILWNLRSEAHRPH
jgi:drug/metabolite transporter (DMT)-like permease